MGAVMDGPGREGPMLVMEFMSNGSLHDVLQVSSSLLSIHPSFPLLLSHCLLVESATHAVEILALALS